MSERFIAGKRKRACRSTASYTKTSARYSPTSASSTPGPAPAVSARSQEAETDERASRKPFRMIVAVTLVAAVVLIGSIAYLAARRSRPARSGPDAQVAGLELISTFSGSHRWPSLSPDGRMVAFVSDAGGTPQVWIKNLATGDPIQITFGDVPACPRWSRRETESSTRARGGGIWSVPPLGGNLVRS